MTPLLLFLFITFASSNAFSYLLSRQKIFEKGINGILCTETQIFTNKTNEKDFDCEIEVSKINSEELLKNLHQSKVAEILCTKSIDTNNSRCEVTIPGVYCEGFYNDDDILTKTDCKVNEAEIDTAALFQSLTITAHFSYREKCFRGAKPTRCLFEIKH